MQATLAGVTRAGSTLVFSGMNLQVLSGSGATDGAVNGLGNVIIGYNESPRTQTGSHNLVLGNQDFESYGGLIAGLGNTITEPYATVTAGGNNTASGFAASVSGGDKNTASGIDPSVSGGDFNTASGAESSVSGGFGNTALGLNSSVAGGHGRVAAADYHTQIGPTDFGP